MNSTIVGRFIAATPAAVYRALVDPEAITRWMFPDGMTIKVHAFDGREGGEFRISLRYTSSDAPGKTTHDTDTYHGRFVKLVPGKLVLEIVEFETDDPALRGEMTITFRLTQSGDGTEIQAVHAMLPAGLRPDANEIGWQMALGKLAALVEAVP